jgi:hypothetical protein
MINYKFEIEGMHVVNTSSTKNYVVTALYQIIGVDDSGVSDSIMDCADFQVNENVENFIPYNELTQEMVESWIIAENGEPHIENLKNIIKDKISYKLNPPVQPNILSAPWK